MMYCRLIAFCLRYMSLPGSTQFDTLSASSSNCAGQHISPVGAGDDDDDFILVADLQSAPLPTRSPSTPSVVDERPTLVHRGVGPSGASSQKHQHPYLPQPGLLREFCGLPCGPVYIVWRIPNCSLQFVEGIHFGENAWEGIVATIPGGHYRRGRDRLCALPESYDQAEPSSQRLRRAAAVFRREARRHGVEHDITVWLWSSHPGAGQHQPRSQS
eukprot:1277065-Amphidinium_carterae.2